MTKFTYAIDNEGLVHAFMNHEYLENNQRQGSPLVSLTPRQAREVMERQITDAGRSERNTDYVHYLLRCNLWEMSMAELFSLYADAVIHWVPCPMEA